jgi:hypothetical protein
MNPKPPILPAMTGAGAICIGLFNGFVFVPWAIAAAVKRPEGGAGIAAAIPGLLGLMAAFTLLQIPAGVGIILHRSWGKKMASGMALGIVITSLLGNVLGILGLTHGYSNVVIGLFGWGFITGLVWAVALNIIFRARSMQALFDGEVPMHTAKNP